MDSSENLKRAVNLLPRKKNAKVYKILGQRFKGLPAPAETSPGIRITISNGAISVS